MVRMVLKPDWEFGIDMYLCACMLSCFSCILLCVTLWTVVFQAPLSIGFSRQEVLGVRCRAFLQRIFHTQESNPRLSCLLHWQVGSLPLAPPSWHVHIPIFKIDSQQGRRKQQPTPVSLPGKVRGQRSLAGYTVHGIAKGSDMT